MLVVDHLTKVFSPPRPLLRAFVKAAATEPVTALEDVSLTVTAGEIVGLVGPNGAGKTTLIKTISTLLTPTLGTVTVDGFDVVSESARVRERIGLVLSDDRGLYWRLTGRENLEFFAAMIGLDRASAQARADELLEEMDLANRDKLVFGYSAGMRSRLNVARALLTQPPLLVMDEPTRSLDFTASRAVYDTIRQLADDGAAVLLASHQLDEVIDVCDRIAVLAEGHLSRIWSDKSSIPELSPEDLAADFERAEE